MIRRGRSLPMCLLGLLSILIIAPAFAQESSNHSAIQVELGLSSWLLSQGETKWSHDFSRLTYKDSSTNIIELSGKATFARRFYVRADYGFGDIGRGHLIDDDFSSANGPLVSRTQSDIQGKGLWYVNGDVGVNLMAFPGGRGTLGVFGGIQYWRQQHQATGVTQVICTNLSFCNPAGTSTNIGQAAITNTTSWTSLRLGVESEFRFTRKLSVEGMVAFLPFTSLSNKDVHHLRTADVATAFGTLPALRQDASFTMAGTGIGADVEVGAKYMLVDRLFLNLGYRLWWNQVLDGTVTSHPVNFPASSLKLNEFQAWRHGLTLGLSYAF